MKKTILHVNKVTKHLFTLSLFIAFFSLNISASNKMCFTADGTLADTSSGSLVLKDPIADIIKYKNLKPPKGEITNIYCNSAKNWLLIAVDIEYFNSYGKAYKSELYFVSIQNPTFKKIYLGHMNLRNRAYELKLHHPRDIVFSKDGNKMVLTPGFFRNDSYYTMQDLLLVGNIDDTGEFEPIYSLNLENILRGNRGNGGYGMLHKIVSVDSKEVKMITTSPYDTDVLYDRNLNYIYLTVIDYKKDSTTKYKLEENYRPTIIGNSGIIVDGKFQTLNSKQIVHDWKLDHIVLKYKGVWENTAFLYGEQYAKNGNDSLGMKAYLVNTQTGLKELSQEITNKLKGFSNKNCAFDKNRSYLYCSSEGKPQVVFSLPDFTDVRKQFTDNIKNTYNITTRYGFKKASPKTRYVPSVSNTKVYSETLFYVGDEPVNRYKNATITDYGYNEKVDMYDVIYEVKNNFSKPLAITFNIQGLAQTSSWSVRNVNTGILDRIFGGIKYARKKSTYNIPIKMQKTIILKAGERFKHKDIWGEKPANKNDVHITITEVKEVDKQWLQTLDMILSKQIPASDDKVEPYLNNPISKSFVLKLKELNQKWRNKNAKDLSKRLIKNIHVVSIKIPDNYDPDFTNKIKISIKNDNHQNVRAEVNLGDKIKSIYINQNQTKSINVNISGIPKAKLKAKILSAQ